MANQASQEQWHSNIDRLAEEQAADTRLRVLHAAYRAAAIAIMHHRGFTQVGRHNRVRVDIGIVPWVIQDTMVHHQSLPIPTVPDTALEGEERTLVIGSVTERHKAGPLGIPRTPYSWASQEFYVRDVTDGPDIYPTFQSRGHVFGSELRDHDRLPYSGCGLAQEWHMAEAFARRLPGLADALGMELPQSFVEFAAADLNPGMP